MKSVWMRPFASVVMLAFLLLGVSSASMAQVAVSISIAPPPIPVYSQPIAPGPGFLWTPGYWAYGVDDYYWVPGTWVRAPYVGALWTPGYWGWRNGFYAWNDGYWGPHVGFYGGVNYGYGYIGTGYHGGYWNNGAFNYNTAVNNVNVTNIHNTYNTVVVNNSVSRVSYHGGVGGINAEPSAEERMAERDRHTFATPMQVQHAQMASTNRAQFASVNHGAPALAATARPAAFNEHPQSMSRAASVNNVPQNATRQVSNSQATNNAHVAGAQFNNGGQLEHANAHPNGGMPRAQNAAHVQGQPQGAHQGGEHHEEGQHSH